MTTRLRLLDLFCGAGGAAMGYYLAGFDVVGVDIVNQPRYPFTFVQGDALEYCAAHGHEFDAIHASPPCQAYSITKSIHHNDHPAMIEDTRDVMITTGKPYVIENVIGAPLRNPLMLCGSMFVGLRVYRHRLFECNPQLFMAPATCHHSFKMPAKYNELNGDNFITCVGHNFKAADGRIAMGIEWMTRAELSQAVPPAYTEYIGRQLLQRMKDVTVGGA